MKISTITCHHVYNFGASLQAYALQTYLSKQGHCVEIIDYRPDYLSRTFSFWAIDHPGWDRFGCRTLYRLLKLPARIRQRQTGKKQAFDDFESNYLHLSRKRFHTFGDLEKEEDYGDLVLAGSDQIWNPFFKNGMDPSFYMEFVKSKKTRKASYAASFAVDQVRPEQAQTIRQWIGHLDAVSVRERTGVQILNSMGLGGTWVCDPVFLLSSQTWSAMTPPCKVQEPFVFVYDFDLQSQTGMLIQKMARGKKVITVYPSDSRFQTDAGMGPLEFLSYVRHADFILTNSYHALLFSLIFHQEFYVIKRLEPINSRMLDLLAYLELDNRLLSDETNISELPPVDWNEIDKRLETLISRSKQYLEDLIHVQ